MDLEGKVITQDDIENLQLVSRGQSRLGEPVLFWKFDKEEEMPYAASLPAFIVGERLVALGEGRYEVRYDLAFQIGITRCYAVVPHLNGEITAPNCVYSKEHKRFVDIPMLNIPPEPQPKTTISVTRIKPGEVVTLAFKASTEKE